MQQARRTFAQQEDLIRLLARLKQKVRRFKFARL